MKKTDYAGIDYGHGMTNIDQKTGTRFGIIPSRYVSEAWWNDSENHYEETCPKCGESVDDYYCSRCKLEWNSEDCYSEEPTSITYNKNGYKCYQSGSDSDIFVEKSPFYTYAQFCSPCAPGACHLENPLFERVGNNRCYCFGIDWFDDLEDCHYDIYSVETNELVHKGA